jgi:hypothetical protein
MDQIPFTHSFVLLIRSSISATEIFVNVIDQNQTGGLMKTRRIAFIIKIGGT